MLPPSWESLPPWVILDIRYLPQPTPWERIFGRPAPLAVEIGFGNGDHLIHLARRQPHHNLIGLEISQPSLRKAAGKVKQQQLNQVRIVYSAAQPFLWLGCAPQTLQQLHINFPDPWPKEAHQERRLISDRFLHLAATRLAPGGELNIATDHPVYQEHIALHLSRTPYFDSAADAPFVVADPTRFVTKYERKALAEGRVCHYYRWRRNLTPAVNIFPLPPELPMPHAIVRLPLTSPPLSQLFQPFAYQAPEAEAHVRFIALYQTPAGDSWLVETFIQEEPLPQRIGLSLHPRDDGAWIIGLHPIGFPRPTEGAHLAVRGLTEWLLAHWPQAEIVHHTLQAWRV